jgi:hypothetical protein
MDDATRADMGAWTGCVAGALTESEFRATLRDAGFADIEIRHTHRVHEHAGSAIIRARKPVADVCSAQAEQETCCAPEAKADCCGTPEAHAGGTCGCR